MINIIAWLTFYIYVLYTYKMAQARVIIISCLTFCVFLRTVSSSVTTDRELFRQYNEIYQKTYADPVEEEMRYKIFVENVNRIKKLNEDYRDVTKFIPNQFSDMTTDEFENTLLMSKRKASEFPRDKYVSTNPLGALPISFDWRTKNMVTSVKDQGSVGTCWAFSTVGNIEGQWSMMGNLLTNMSVEQLVDCDSTQDGKDKEADCGVFGGWPFLAYQYIKKVGGLESWDDYGYCSGSGKCFPCAAPGYNKTLCGPPVPSSCNKNESCDARLNKTKFIHNLNVTGWNAFSQNETELAYELMKRGPLSVLLNAELLQFYHRGVFEPHHCNPKALDHAVLLVGFGIDKSIFGEKPYWIVKNSWGQKWGQHGYFWIRRGEGMCGINTHATSAVLKKE